MVPVYKTQTVTKDYGHYETIVEEVPTTTTYANPVETVSAAPCSGVVSDGVGCDAGVASSVVYANGACGPQVAVQSGCGHHRGHRHAHGCRACGRNHGSCGTTASCGAPSIASYGCGSSLGIAPSVAECGSQVSYATSAVGNAAPCGVSSVAAPAVRTISRQVWVPNVVTEEVPLGESTTQTEEIAYTVYEQKSEQIPYECTYIVNRPEQRKATRKVVDYKDETRERTRKAVKYVDETRTRTRKELTYKTETKQETYPVVNYKTEKKTKDISFTINVPEQIVEPYQSVRYDQVAEDVVEEYTVSFQVPTMKEAKVQVCRMVPKLVPYTYSPCSKAVQCKRGKPFMEHLFTVQLHPTAASEIRLLIQASRLD